MSCVPHWWSCICIVYGGHVCVLYMYTYIYLEIYTTEWYPTEWYPTMHGTQLYPLFIHTDAIIAITCVILLLLFLVQMLGTAKISYAFSPVVFIWLIFNMVCGIINIVSYQPGVFSALSPYWAFTYLVDDFGQAWLSLSSILLSFTGVEALFADLGHFNRPSIQLSCFFIVFPCVTLTYLGQAAYLTVWVRGGGWVVCLGGGLQ